MGREVGMEGEKDYSGTWKSLSRSVYGKMFREALDYLWEKSFPTQVSAGHSVVSRDETFLQLAQDTTAFATINFPRLQETVVELSDIKQHLLEHPWADITFFHVSTATFPQDVEKTKRSLDILSDKNALPDDKIHALKGLFVSRKIGNINKIADGFFPDALAEIPVGEFLLNPEFAYPVPPALLSDPFKQKDGFAPWVDFKKGLIYPEWLPTNLAEEIKALPPDQNSDQVKADYENLARPVSSLLPPTSKLFTTRYMPLGIGGERIRTWKDMFNVLNLNEKKESIEKKSDLTLDPNFENHDLENQGYVKMFNDQYYRPDQDIKNEKSNFLVLLKRLLANNECHLWNVVQTTKDGKIVKTYHLERNAPQGAIPRQDLLYYEHLLHLDWILPLHKEQDADFTRISKVFGHTFDGNEPIFPPLSEQEQQREKEILDQLTDMVPLQEALIEKKSLQAKGFTSSAIEEMKRKDLFRCDENGWGDTKVEKLLKILLKNTFQRINERIKSSGFNDKTRESWISNEYYKKESKKIRKKFGHGAEKEIQSYVSFAFDRADNNSQWDFHNDDSDSSIVSDKEKSQDFDVDKCVYDCLHVTFYTGRYHHYSKFNPVFSDFNHDFTEKIFLWPHLDHEKGLPPGEWKPRLYNFFRITPLHLIAKDIVGIPHEEDFLEKIFWRNLENMYNTAGQIYEQIFYAWNNTPVFWLLRGEDGYLDRLRFMTFPWLQEEIAPKYNSEHLGGIEAYFINPVTPKLYYPSCSTPQKDPHQQNESLFNIRKEQLLFGSGGVANKILPYDLPPELIEKTVPFKNPPSGGFKKDDRFKLHQDFNSTYYLGHNGSIDGLTEKDLPMYPRFSTQQEDAKYLGNSGNQTENDIADPFFGECTGQRYVDRMDLMFGWGKLQYRSNNNPRTGDYFVQKNAEYFNYLKNLKIENRPHTQKERDRLAYMMATFTNLATMHEPGKAWTGHEWIIFPYISWRLYLAWFKAKDLNELEKRFSDMNLFWAKKVKVTNDEKTEEFIPANNFATITLNAYQGKEISPKVLLESMLSYYLWGKLMSKISCELFTSKTLSFELDEIIFTQAIAMGKQPEDLLKEYGNMKMEFVSGSYNASLTLKEAFNTARTPLTKEKIEKIKQKENEPDTTQYQSDPFATLTDYERDIARKKIENLIKSLPKKSAKKQPTTNKSPATTTTPEITMTR